MMRIENVCATPAIHRAMSQRKERSLHLWSKFRWDFMNGTQGQSPTVRFVAIVWGLVVQKDNDEIELGDEQAVLVLTLRASHEWIIRTHENC